MLRVLESHPDHPEDMEFLIDIVTECSHCAIACNACADACLAEENVDHLRNCISLNLSCADICTATARVMSRAMDVGADVTPALLEVCAQICEACADECGKHADMHEHCAACAEACDKCAEVCRGANSTPAYQAADPSEAPVGAGGGEA